MREKIINWVERYKIIAIVRGAEPAQCITVARALYAGGIRLMEITYDQKHPASWQATADTIAALVREYEGRMLIGAGTVTNPGLVEMTAKAGGGFIISPDTDLAVIRKTRELGLVSMPGAMTPSEIKTAHDAGADFVKVFPLGVLGPGYLKAVRAPLGHIRMMAVGGINEKNLRDYLEAGACGAGIGGNLVNRKWIESGELDKITAAAKELTEIAEAFDRH